MTHTPEPWERHTAPNGTHIWSGDKHIADVDDHDDGHLIATAPKLLRDLGQAVEMADAVIKNLGCEDWRIPFARDSWKATIAEAEGE